MAAELNLKLDKSASPLPEDSIFRVRYKSTFGLKYVEIVRGEPAHGRAGRATRSTASTTAAAARCPLPIDQADLLRQTSRRRSKDGCFQTQTEFDAIANTFDQKTRNAGRQDLIGFGNAFAGARRLAERGDRPPRAAVPEPEAGREEPCGPGHPARAVHPGVSGASRRSWPRWRSSSRSSSPTAPITFAAISADPAGASGLDLRRPARCSSRVRASCARAAPVPRATSPSSRRRLQPGRPAAARGAARPARRDHASARRSSTAPRPCNAKLARRLRRSFESWSSSRRRRSRLQRLKETFDSAKPLAKLVRSRPRPSATTGTTSSRCSRTRLSDRDQISFRQSGSALARRDRRARRPQIDHSQGRPRRLLGDPGRTARPGRPEIPSDGRPPNTSRRISSPILQGHPYGPDRPAVQRHSQLREQARRVGLSPNYHDTRLPAGPDRLSSRPRPRCRARRRATRRRCSRTSPAAAASPTCSGTQNGKRVIKDTRIPSHQP